MLELKQFLVGQNLQVFLSFVDRRKDDMLTLEELRGCSEA